MADTVDFVMEACVDCRKEAIALSEICSHGWICGKMGRSKIPPGSRRLTGGFMSKVYDWIEQNPKATRIWILIAILGLIAGLSVPVFLFIPGFLDGLKEMHRQSPARFYVFVVAPAVITTACALIWSIGDGWERLGAALYLNDNNQGDDD